MPTFPAHTQLSRWLINNDIKRHFDGHIWFQCAPAGVLMRYNNRRLETSVTCTEAKSSEK